MKRHYKLLANALSILMISMLLLSAQNLHAATGETNNKKDTDPKSKILERQAFSLIKTDSLKSNSKSIHRNDSLSYTSKEKSNSGVSYNILFQVIYRNSFSEIFEEKN